MSVQGYATPGLENVQVKRQTLSLKVRLVGSATEGSITADVLNCPDAGARVWLSLNSLTAPADANFASLLSAGSPTVIGLYASIANARWVHNATVPVATIRSGSMTAGVVTLKGADSDITGKTGVTSGANLALQVSCTGLQLNLAQTHEFDVELAYSLK